MIQIISNTPIYVWLLLVYLIRGGWKSRRDYTVAWKDLLVTPAIMFFWSIYSTVTRYEGSTICLWVVSLSLGIWVGLLTVRRLRLSFDKQKNLIEIAGNWTPMILSLTIFSLRYFLGAVYGLHPVLVGSYKMLAIECMATIVSGMFTGRLIGYYLRSKTASHNPFHLNQPPFA